MERIYSKGRRQEPLPDQKIGCWIWEGTINRCGYGAVWIFGRRWLTHMLSLMATEGITEIPTDDIGRRMQVRHKCKSKACCEPTHLELGTHDENMQDKFRDGTCIRGENHPNRGITEALAKEIKQSWLPVDDSNRVTLAERANRFGVSIKLVSSIDHGHAWAHVAGPNDEKLATKIVERKQSKRSKLLEAQKEGLTVNDLAYLRQRIYDKSTIQSTPGVADTPCRLWNGSLRRGGYGVLNYKYMQLLCYTTICEFKHGPRPSSDQVARHLCGNKLCVEQNHLQWGTRRENALDAINHGHLRTKLTAAKVKEIRVILTRDRSKGTLLKLCSSYGVTIHTIKKILYNQMWKH
jgi:hypothetical protein